MNDEHVSLLFTIQCALYLLEASNEQMHANLQILNHFLVISV